MDDLISRQAAIDTIESWLVCDDYNEAERHIMRAMQSVLYDLPPVKLQESYEDVVSRQAVEKITWEEPSYADALNVLTDVRDKVRALPSVIPQPKTGRWISHREHCENLGVMPSGLGAYEWCSNCDCGIDVREWHKNHYNYCPNCGAKMESEE